MCSTSGRASCGQKTCRYLCGLGLGYVEPGQAHALLLAPNGTGVKHITAGTSSAASLAHSHSDEMSLCFLSQAAILIRKAEQVRQREQLAALLVEGDASGVHPLDQPALAASIKVAAVIPADSTWCPGQLRYLCMQRTHITAVLVCQLGGGGA